MFYTEFEFEDGTTFLWKDCEVPGCTNQVCLWLSDKYCWPHSMMGGDPNKELIEDETPVKEPL